MKSHDSSLPESSESSSSAQAAAIDRIVDEIAQTIRYKNLRDSGKCQDVTQEFRNDVAAIITKHLEVEAAVYSRDFFHGEPKPSPDSE